MSIFTGICPDSSCGEKLFFLQYKTDVECTKCGQQHKTKDVVNAEPITNPTATLQNLLCGIFAKTIPQLYRKTSDSVKVKGLSNYVCKLISPLLTKYGLDKLTQSVKLLKVMGQGEIFDCSHLGDRAFRIEEKKLDVPGYGRDMSMAYLADTLREISKVNNNEECLVPIHADGDGHCLLHAVSRALVGHELFWHPLMTNLKAHLEERRNDYKNLFCDFFEESDWDNIIKEADPNFIPSNGESHGLCNIHIFGLANVLHRAIILIDSLEGMESKGDYSAVFVPALVATEKCCNKDEKLHKPIIISWSSKGRNHFVPLVGIKEKALPKFPKYLLPKLWGLPQHLLTQYIEFEEGHCVIGGDKTLSDQYLLKLVSAMEKHFTVLNGVTPHVVQDVYQHIIKPNDNLDATTQMVIETAREIVNGERLYICLLCQSVTELEDPCPRSWLEPDGKLYKLAKEIHGELKDGFHYKFPNHNNILCSYNAEKNKLLFVQDLNTLKCKHCQGSLRLLKSDGTIVYLNGDQVHTPASGSSKCGCGFKHYWDGKEYDNLPRKIPVLLEWGGRTETDYVFWFQDEGDNSLNSNAFESAQKIVHKYFPGEFGSERIVQRVVEQIFHFTLKDEKVSKSIHHETPATPTKIILTGAKSKTMHKEELSASKTEQVLRKKIEHGAIVKQKRLSSSPLKESLQHGEGSKKVAVISKTSPPQISQPVGAKRIRISLSNSQRSEVFNLQDTTCFNDLQLFIQKAFDINADQQIIKHGFPPKPIEFDDVFEPLKLRHGERLVVHVKKFPEIENNTPMELVPNDVKNVAGEAVTESYSADGNLHAFASELSNLFQNMDFWEWACSDRKLFQKGGLFYQQAFNDLGNLRDNQHFSLPYFPKKLFSYNQKEDEIFLCLGKTHISVRKLTAEEENIADRQNSRERSSNDLPQPAVKLSTGHSFTMINKPTHSNVEVFSGVGHSMVDQKTDVTIQGSSIESHSSNAIANTVEPMEVSSSSDININPNMETFVGSDTDTNEVELSMGTSSQKSLEETLN